MVLISNISIITFLNFAFYTRAASLLASRGLEARGPYFTRPRPRPMRPRPEPTRPRLRPRPEPTRPRPRPTRPRPGFLASRPRPAQASRLNITGWRHLDMALSRISWLFSIFLWNFLRKHKKTSNFRAHLYVFEGKESNGDKHTEVPSAVDLENPDQLPIQEVLRGTDDCAL